MKSNRNPVRAQDSFEPPDHTFETLDVERKPTRWITGISSVLLPIVAVSYWMMSRPDEVWVAKPEAQVQQVKAEQVKIEKPVFIPVPIEPPVLSNEIEKAPVVKGHEIPVVELPVEKVEILPEPMPESLVVQEAAQEEESEEEPEWSRGLQAFNISANEALKPNYDRLVKENDEYLQLERQARIDFERARKARFKTVLNLPPVASSLNRAPAGGVCSAKPPANPEASCRANYPCRRCGGCCCKTEAVLSSMGI
jgi:hypothetical protein